VQKWQPAAKAAPDAEVGDFDGKGIGIAIHDETAEGVAIGMDHAPGLADGVEFELVAPEADRSDEGSVEFVFGEKGFAVVKHAKRDLRSWVQETRAKGLAITIIDIDEIPSGGVRGSGADHVGEDGGVEGDIFELCPRCGPVFAAFWGRDVGAGAGSVGGTGRGARRVAAGRRPRGTRAVTIERTFLGGRHGEKRLLLRRAIHGGWQITQHLESWITGI